MMEECGRTLTASPLFSSAVLGATAIARGGSDDQKNELLPSVAGGELLLALALEESPHHNPYNIATTAESAGGAIRSLGARSSCWTVTLPTT